MLLARWIVFVVGALLLAYVWVSNVRYAVRASMGDGSAPVAAPVTGFVLGLVVAVACPFPLVWFRVIAVLVGWTAEIARRRGDDALGRRR